MNQTGELMKMKTKNPFVFLYRFFLLAPSPLDQFPSLLPCVAAQTALQAPRGQQQQRTGKPSCVAGAEVGKSALTGTPA